jgi:cell division protein FtsI (penicillin-binding protein 3)
LNVPGLRSRTLILAALFACAFLGLVGRLAYLQGFHRAELAAAAERQYARTVTIRPKRGPILDRHGHVLAVSSAAESLFAQPRRLENPAGAARRLAPILGEPEAAVRRRLESDRSFVWLRRRLPPPTAAAVRALGEPGLGLAPETMRLYPNRELAAHVLGFEGVDGIGLEGIERAWDAHLAGAPGRAIVERDALGRDVTTSPTLIKPPTAGAGLSLTIDTTIQYLAEREIDAAYGRTGAKAAVAVVMDPRTGEILALAVRPTFNPNGFALAGPNEWRNRAVTDPFEPGSTFKVILAAAALEAGVIKPTDRVYAGDGVITVANTTIRDWKQYGWLTFAEVLQNSSNVGAVKVGLTLGRDRYYRSITDFGFGAVTGVGLPGESRGMVRDPRRWSGLSLATVSFGQEISVTALQLVAAFGAVANGGRLMQPQIARALLDAEGRETRIFEPRVVRQVIAPETARTLTRLLVNVVENGTGHAAAIPGYEVGGKTGTAQKLDPGTRRYSHRPGVLSFVGFAPADDPRFVMLVLLDEPQNERWGSEAAAPIFSAIGGEVLRYLGVPPFDATPVQLVTSVPIRLASTAARSSLGPLPDPSGRGAPRPEGAEPAPVEARDAMPDLAGKTLRQALAALAERSVEVEIRGRGVVVGQAPPPGAALAAGAAARLELRPR